MQIGTLADNLALMLKMPSAAKLIQNVSALTQSNVSQNSYYIPLDKLLGTPRVMNLPNNISLRNYSYKTLFTSTMYSAYWNTGTNAWIDLDETLQPVTCTGANSNAVKWNLTPLLKNTLTDLSNPDKQNISTIFGITRTTNTGGGMQDLSKALAYGFSEKLSSGMIIPPILPMVNLVCTFMADYMAGQRQANVIVNDDNMIHTVFAYNASIQVVGVLPSVTDNFTPVIFHTWISLNQYMAYSINPSLSNPAIAGLDTIRTNERIGSHYFIPILKSMVNDADSCTQWALAFTGYNTNTIPQNLAGQGWMPKRMFTAFDLPVKHNGGNIYFTYVVIDAVGTSNLFENGTIVQACPYNVIHVTAIATVGQVRTHMGANTSKWGYILQLMRWYSGPQLPLVLYHSALRSYWKTSVYTNFTTLSSVNPNWLDTARFAVGDLLRLKTAAVEYQHTPTVNNGQTYPARITSTLPYATGDHILWALGKLNVTGNIDMGGHQTACFLKTIFALDCERVSSHQLLSNTFVDFSQAGDQFEANDLFDYRLDLYPESLFKQIIFPPHQNTVFSIAMLQPKTLLNAAQVFLHKWAPSPMGVSPKMIEYFSSTTDTMTEIKQDWSFGNYFTYTKPSRYLWWDQNTHWAYVGGLGYDCYSTLNTLGINDWPIGEGDRYLTSPKPTYYLAGVGKALLVMNSLVTLGSIKSSNELHLRGTDTSFKIDSVEKKFRIVLQDL